MTTTATETVAPGTMITINPAFRESFGFTTGRVVRLDSDPGETARWGGRYRVERLDGEEFLLDIQPSIQRSTFTPVSPEEDDDDRLATAEEVRECRNYVLGRRPGSK